MEWQKDPTTLAILAALERHLKDRLWELNGAEEGAAVDLIFLQACKENLNFIRNIESLEGL